MAVQIKTPDLRERQGADDAVLDHRRLACDRRVKSNTQQGMVLELLRQQPMSAGELQWNLPIADARAVVRELRGKGYRIDLVKHPRAKGHPVQRYHLIEMD